MNTNKETIYNYSYLFVVALVFSALATEIFLLYLFLRQIFPTVYEPSIVVIVLSIFFSALGQRLSKVNGIGKWIASISTASSGIYYFIFVSPKIENYLIVVSLYAMVAFVVWTFWDPLANVWTYISKTKVSKKPTIVMVTTGVVGIFALYLVFVYSTTIVSFFDRHPWAMTLIGVVLTLLGGIVIGRRTKSS